MTFRLLVPLFGIALLLSPQPASTQTQSAPGRVLTGHVPPAAKSLSPIGRLMDNGKLHLAIGLPVRDPAGLKSFLQALYDPTSPQYHQYLSPAEFTERFGPTQNDYNEVIRFAESHGFEVVGTHPNRIVLDVRALPSQVERAFHVNLQRYPHPTEGREFYAPDTEPSLDSNVPILHVAGLDNYSLPKPKHFERLGPVYNATPNAGSGPSGTYWGNDFRSAYLPGISLTGTGQSVALLEFDGYYASDITKYETQSGLPNVPLTNVPVNGGVSSITSNGAGEVSLDIEVAIAMAPGLSRVYVYEAPNGPTPWSTILSKIANDNLSRQISCSWGGGGPDATSEQIFQQMAAQGQTFFNASGDNDAFTGAIAFPSDSPNVVQVGGTTLNTSGPGGSWTGESVWNWGNGTGSGGGISTYYSIPSWQQGISMTSNGGSTTKRNVPDVALTADSIWVFYNNNSSGSFGGTSCAAPLWAGVTALINQQAAANSQPPVGYINPAIYAIGKGANYTTDFRDITSGNNTWSGSPNKFFAVTGYDLCTGWGTPAPALIAALSGGGGGGTTYAITTSASPSNGGTTSGDGTFPANSSQTVTATPNTGYNFVNWTENGSPVSTSASYTFTLTANRNLVANFTSSGGGSSQDLFSPNGGFENGVTSDWSLVGNGQIIQNSFPHSGSWDAYLGNVNNASASLTHSTVTIPANATGATLSFWLNVVTQESSSDPNSYDFFNVNLIDGSNTTHLLGTFSNRDASPNTNGSYTLRSFDVSAYAGQQVQIQFTATTDFSLPTTFRIDDVGLNVTAPPTTYTISTSSSPINGGTTSGGGSGFTANSSCTVTANPANGFAFVNWTENGNVVSSSASYTFTVTGDRTLVANFSGGSTTNYTISTSSLAGYAGSTSGGGLFAANTTQTVVASPNNGYTFVNWMENGSVVSTSASYSFTLTGNRNLIANFSANPSAASDLYSPDGGFESAGTTAGTDWLLGGNASVGQDGHPNTGSWDSDLAGANNAVDTLTHSFVTIPANATSATLSYWLNIVTQEQGGGGPYDHLTVSLIDASGVVHQIATYSELDAGSNTDGSYTQYSFDVSAYKGQQVQLQFIATNDILYPTRFRVDDVSLVAPQPLANYTIGTSSAPSNGGTTGGGGNFNANSSCTVTASPNSGYNFVNWTENGSPVSTSASYTFTVTGNRTLVANFAPAPSSYTVSVTAQPTNGGTVAGAGTFAANTSRTVTATAKSGFTFANWTQNGTVVSTSASYTFTLASNRSLVANFNPSNGTAQMINPVPGSTFTSSTVSFSWTSGSATQYRLSIGSSPGTGDLYNGTAISAKSATVTNLPTDGRTIYVRLWSHVGFSWPFNDYTYVSGGTAPVSYTVSTSASPSNGGTISGGGNFNANTSCTVVASPNSGYNFVNWTENGNPVSTSASYTFTVTANRTLVANFTATTVTTYTVNTSSAPTTGGTTSGGGNFNPNASCTVVASPNSGYNFVNWTENGSPVSTTASYTFTVTANRTLVANFAANTSNYTVKVTGEPTNGGTVTGAGSFAPNTSQTVTATAKAGFGFVNWTENGSIVSTSPSYTFNLTQNRNLVANFNNTNGAAQVTSPVPGSTLHGSSVTFSWSNGNGSQYILTVGSTLGGSDYYAGTTTTAHSATVNGLPTDGRTIYVRLRTRVGVPFLNNDYVYVSGP